MNAIILHSVAANAGDELLLRSSINLLKKYLDIDVVAASTNSSVNFSFMPVPEHFLNDSFSFKPNPENNLIFSFLKDKEYLPYKLRYYFPLLFDADYWKLKKVLKKTEIVFLCPGGFIHEYYGFSNIASIVSNLSNMGKRVIVLGQSVGPFSEKNTRDMARQLFDCVEKIILREKYSKEYLDDLYGGCCDKALVYTDLAFGYNAPDSCSKKKQKRLNRVLVNFRELRDESIQNDALIDKAVNVVRCIAYMGYGVDFLSTCQGVQGYRDDTGVADQIKAELDRCDDVVDFVIHRKRLSIDEYLETVGNYKYYVGMRMHAAIMPILVNVPALNIGYEPKTKGVFNTVGLGDFALDINDSQDEILDNVKKFFSFDYEFLCERYRIAREKGYAKSNDAILSLKKILK